MQVINNNLFAQVSSETSATVSGGVGEYGYYQKGPNVSFNNDNYLLALGAFYQNAPDVPGTIFGTALINNVVTSVPIPVRGITNEESLEATKIGFGIGVGGWW
ncbi:hypothetical protein Ava_2396 [Trichormus variabilis ATCC 29413]|uniref:Uncharacterized protein n=2 Tax=Anabaena variabilis TaxID=264691 RepID=Q3MAH3_TRIV2|nr:MULTISPECIES: hypothetical protein [Nostocaceae]ABA22013.1 hypothetical protein Ava_2396 [Trichormus variabilis ATCC 29413]MBC1215949.1 hypothetical protein [Trichormus variabilis ARAD]MBC1257353.1 hypothetical protein [Trichormus variabilis V5]MBC1267854.1 hypothetical protein [Trichormus variabilis FSR]MBC1304146.1 hypothetical protein [Trichormus variabilis N2B]